MLLNCRASESQKYRSIWTHTTGVVLYGVWNLPNQQKLWENVKPFSINLSILGIFTTVNLDLKALIKEMESINRHFMSIMYYAPATLCIVPTPSNATMKSIVSPS